MTKVRPCEERSDAAICSSSLIVPASRPRTRSDRQVSRWIRHIVPVGYCEERSNAAISFSQPSLGGTRGKPGQVRTACGG